MDAPVHMILVTNGSRRPVRAVASKIKTIQTCTYAQDEELADVWAAMEAYGIESSVQEDGSFSCGHRAKRRC